jgi:hypothetical protein
MKHGVKSYLWGLKGPQPSLLPHNGCPRSFVAVKYPPRSRCSKLANEPEPMTLCKGDEELATRMTDIVTDSALRRLFVSAIEALSA